MDSSTNELNTFDHPQDSLTGLKVQLRGRGERDAVIQDQHDGSYFARTCLNTAGSPTAADRLKAERVVACINACAGIHTEDLRLGNIKISGDGICKHDFARKGEEKTNIGYQRNPIMLVEEVYWCKCCLEEVRIKLREEVQSREKFGWEVSKTYPRETPFQKGK